MTRSTPPATHAMLPSSLITDPAAPREKYRVSPGIIPTDRLFGQSQEILISHNGEHYRLRITKNDKLILTK